MKVAKDSGLVYIAQNAFRHPKSPLEPLFRSLLLETPSYNFQKVNLVTDRNNIRKLLSFVNPNLSRNRSEPFTINVEVIGNTAIFCRAETKTHEFIKPGDFRGHGHEFEKAFTVAQVFDSTGHHRIISYDMDDLKLIVRYETDAYVEAFESPVPSMGSKNESLLDMMENLSLSRAETRSSAAIGEGLMIQERGKQVPIGSTLEIKTRVAHKPIDLQEILPQLWVSQTPKLVRAYHKNGLFQPPEVEDVTSDITQWERSHANDIRRLIILLKEITAAVKEVGGAGVIKYGGLNPSLTVSKAEDSKMLPDDLYSYLAGQTTTAQQIELGSEPTKTNLKIGDSLYNVDISTIPYLSAFVRFQRNAHSQDTDLIHGDIPLFQVALKGLESGYRQCFRLLGKNTSQYHTLCETYDFLGVNVLAGQSLDDIFSGLKACKTDYALSLQRYLPFQADKCRARDAAFRFVFLMIRGEFRDEQEDAAKGYNAALFVVSHPGTFKKNARIVVRSVFEERFVISKKQRNQLDRWQNKYSNDSSGNESTTDDEPFDDLSEGYTS